ncbi:MAG: FtsQ-type POTRA domain-containing protein [Coriobacteriia bacterium]|nr:FtsQ-type POTRA domain-containing protein [Coriobacteriia bacterium]
MTVAAVLVTGAIVGLNALYRSHLFAVREIEVLGNDQLSRERVLEIAAVPSDATLIRFPSDEVSERLNADPWIADAQVTRDFPETMRIRVTERVPVAYVDLGGADLFLVDAEGFVLGEQTAETTRTLMVVRDLEGVEPRIGEKTMSEPLLNSLNVLGGLSDSLRERTRAISAPSIDRTALMTTDDIEIVIGSAEDIAAKDEIARTILSEQEGKVVYINVRTVDRPVWRGLEE